MTTGVLVSWGVYLVAAGVFAYLANRSLRSRHERRMTQLDAAIQLENQHFREVRAEWAAEDEEYRGQVERGVNGMVGETVSSASAVA